MLVSWDMGATPVRPWPEMNGDWQPFQPTAAGDRPAGGTYAEFRAAWRHVVTYLRDHGATNLRWVSTRPPTPTPRRRPVKRIWPGSRYVDVLGLDGFNWATVPTACAGRPSPTSSGRSTRR